MASLVFILRGETMFKRISRNIEYNSSKYVCDSTDTKPTTGVEFGDFCLEIDTGNVYTFNGTAWQYQAGAMFIV